MKNNSKLLIILRIEKYDFQKVDIETYQYLKFNSFNSNRFIFCLKIINIFEKSKERKIKRRKVRGGKDNYKI
jgi:hypothetical protein